MAIKTVRERRKVQRIEFQGRVVYDHREATAPQLQTPLEASSMNLSEGGLCVRLREALEVRSPVRLRVFAQPHAKPLECPGRIAWVVQRLDLRDSPPFLYDVGVEFIDPPPRFRQFASRSGIALRPSREPTSQSGVAAERPTQSALQATMINGRCYVPRLEQEPSPSRRWHLIVTVDGTPCFSGRYPSIPKALEFWKQFKRQAALSRPRAS
jgi:hypothetical protein